MHIYNPLSNHYILIQVFGFLKNQRDIYNCTLVNSQWNISATPFLYRAPRVGYSNNQNIKYTSLLRTIKEAKENQTFQPYNEMVREWNIKESVGKDTVSVIKYCPNIEILSCNNEAFILDEEVEGGELLKIWNKLKSIKLYHGTDSVLDVIRINCCRLEELTLGYFSVTDIGLIETLKNYKGLKSLRLIQCHKISDQSLIMMTKCCDSLINLDLRDCKGISDAGILSLANPLFAKNLHSLHLEALDIKEISLLALAEHTINLQELHLRRLEFVNDEIVAAFCKSCLKQLTLHLCPKVVGWGIKEAREIKELSLFMQKIKLQELDAICETCKLLEKFTLDIITYSFSSSNVDVINTLSQLKNLRSLALFCGINFSKYDIYELKRSCKKLSQIHC